MMQESGTVPESATVDRLCALLPGLSGALRERAAIVREIRLRAGKPPQLVCGDEDTLSGPPLEPGTIARVLSSLLDHSLYAREDELAQGFFTLADGARVGVCGRLLTDGGHIGGMASVGSLCVRVSRQIPGCADALLPLVIGDGAPRSLLIASAPGMGKTTCLRELARRLSDGGLRVAIADERHELAACRDGVPTLDVGARTDVMDGGPKALSITRLIRAMAPRVIVTDEIGGPGDADSLREAVRCGVTVIASAHGESLDALSGRAAISPLLREGVFYTIALLADEPGKIGAIHRREKAKDGTWRYVMADDLDQWMLMDA